MIVGCRFCHELLEIEKNTFREYVYRTDHEGCERYGSTLSERVRCPHCKAEFDKQHADGYMEQAWDNKKVFSGEEILNENKDAVDANNNKIMPNRLYYKEDGKYKKVYMFYPDNF